MTEMTSPDVPSMGRRQFMNLLTFGTVTGVALGALYPVGQYFTPARAGGAGAPNTISGSDVTYAGGGGGGNEAQPITPGGAGGGGCNGPSSNGGVGGSGIVVIRYKFQ